MLRIYLAARYGRRAEMQRIGHALEGFGHHVTARWISGAHETDAGVPDLKAALEDIQDVEAADIVVSFTETGDVPGRSRGGRHVEFGYALAKGKRLIVVGTRENVFHHVPGVEVVGSVAQLFRLLGAEASNGKAW